MRTEQRLDTVGEKGLTLSGGQKARVALARAVYSQAQVLVLEDVLAALDVHAAKRIVEKCLRGDLVRGRILLCAEYQRLDPGLSDTRPITSPWQYPWRTLSFPLSKMAGFRVNEVLESDKALVVGNAACRRY